MRIAKGQAQLYSLRQQQAAEAGRKKRTELASEAGIMVPTVKVDKGRITLPRVSIQHPGEPIRPLAHYQQGEPE